ncbi:MAG: adenylate/guanylate cyclase domain-containing protein [Spirochaetia bacterium]|jgi:class 3 adenylate cyclase/PAS domain-containing protein|nr:adenylate/guanylate cyclase domain-containing protein [Spirochaetia bacterium]
MRIFAARHPVQTATAIKTQTRDSFDELSRASALLSGGTDFSQLQSILVEQACDISQSDLAALYLYVGDSDDDSSALKLSYRRGPGKLPSTIERLSETIRFIEECAEAAIINERRDCALAGMLLDPAMNAGIVVPIFLPHYRAGLLFLNARSVRHYDRKRLNFLIAYGALAAGMLRNAKLFKELKERSAEIEALERYQKSVFSSMTNLLVTTSRDGTLRFYNDEAADAFGLDADSIGKPATMLLKDHLDHSIISAMDKSLREGTTLLGVEGIASAERGDIDFSLNLSPVRGRRSDRPDGLVLTFTDQTRERELKEQVNVVVEERRAIKDMFSRYLSANVVQSLMDSPDSIKLGGDGKRATVFFADIRGYTTFSEGKTPEFILGVLNDYFSEAVEVVLKYRGFIDKFIGDCIMAAWGVPMTSEEEDARNAVACALEIQKLIDNPKRRFFKGEAEHLRVGIGVNTGYLIAGNLGSARHMNYSVIGDTVNIAARLEGVAKAGEVIITESTRVLLDDSFKVEERDTVKVKGKMEPLRIYRALSHKIK